jgi:hypothetical protein
MWFIVAAFVAGMAGLGWFLRRREQEGSFDAGPSSVSQPGLRRFFDFGDRGWSQDGVNQRPRRP